MQILVVNNVRGDFNYLTQQIENCDPDCVVLIGNSGIYKGDSSDFNVKDIHGYDKEMLLHGRNSFVPFLEGEKKFSVPVYALNYVYDNSRLFKSLQKFSSVENFIAMVSGELYEVNGCKLAGLGGRYLGGGGAGNITTLSNVRQLMSHKQVDLFFMNEPVGGKPKDGSWDLFSTYDLEDRKIGIYDINDQLNVRVAFFGGDMEIVGDDYISYTSSGSIERFFCWCKSMKQICYIYDTELRQIIYV